MELVPCTCDSAIELWPARASIGVLIIRIGLGVYYTILGGSGDLVSRL